MLCYTREMGYELKCTLYAVINVHDKDLISMLGSCFLYFSVSLLVMLCCCQLRRLGLDFVNKHISGSNHVYKRVKLASRENILKICFCAFKIFLFNHPSELRMQSILYSGRLIIFPACVEMLPPWFAWRATQTFLSWLAEHPPRGRSFFQCKRRQGIWDHGLLMLCRWGCGPYQRF